MQRFTVLGFCLLAVTVAFTTLGIASENEFNMRVPMGALVLKPPSSIEPKRANVKFPHARHFVKVSCHECHHNWNGITPIQSCSTSGCHDFEKTIQKKKEMDQATGVRYYKKAFHSQCIGCHKALSEELKKIEYSMTSLSVKLPTTGPTGCVGCHPE